MSGRPLAALVIKDLRVFLVDRYAVVLTILAPIVLASFMAVIFGGAGPTTPSPVPIRIIDEDQSVTSKAIVAGAEADPLLAAVASGREAAVGAVRSGHAVVAVVIPAGFGATAAEALLGPTDPPDLTFILDPTHQAEVALARGTLTRLIFQAVVADALEPSAEDHLLTGSGDGTHPDRGGSTAETPDPFANFLALFPEADRTPAGHDTDYEVDRADFQAAFPGLVDRAMTVEPESSAPPSPREPSGVAAPYRSRDLSITAGPHGDTAALAGHAFAGMAVQFVLFSATEWGVGLLRERRQGLWKRLRSSPVSRHTLMASKAIGCTLLSVAVISIVFGAGALLFGFRIRGSGVGFALVTLSYAATAATFGLLVASLGRSPEGARAVSILAVLAMTMLGGGWIPSFLFPAWLQRLTTAIPTRWAIDGFDGVISRGFTLGETLPSVAVLGGFSTAFAFAAVICHRWDEG